MKYQLCFLLLLGTTAASLAQGLDGVSSSATSSSSSTEVSSVTAPAIDAPLPENTRAAQTSTMTTMQQKKKDQTPIGSVAMSYVYLFQTSPTDRNHSMMGFAVTPEINLTRHIGFQGDFTSLYVMGVDYNQRRLIMAAGPRYTFAPHSRFTPFVYGEGGEMRSVSSQNNLVDWNPVAKAGVGIDMKVTRSIAFQLIPGEYQGERVDASGKWNQSFSSRAGIVFNLYK
ncbi:MAG: hypothetical protein PW789_10090 [Edaphobacter sp.]|uniref:hypothetical protein n=1 Tax=Edaphobacter sp. TaxID=1934404 RepID=UPI00238EE80C|nr:hypothetical protein [Edaphobacter sp.]MDE1176941.1 hypothetical protein [Edaphobacter sp.]